jgi:hypothetical protein
VCAPIRSSVVHLWLSVHGQLTDVRLCTRSSWKVIRSGPLLNTHSLRCRTSSDHRLNVSMSLVAHALAPPLASIHPARAMLQPRLPTCIPALSSARSSEFEVHTILSELAESSSYSPVGANIHNHDILRICLRVCPERCGGRTEGKEVDAGVISASLVPAASICPSGATSRLTGARERPKIRTIQRLSMSWLIVHRVYERRHVLSRPTVPVRSATPSLARLSRS